jgi:hypothetical protein
VAQLVEHHLAKVGVAGSNPVVRSRSERFRLSPAMVWVTLLVTTGEGKSVGDEDDPTEGDKNDPGEPEHESVPKQRHGRTFEDEGIRKKSEEPPVRRSAGDSDRGSGESSEGSSSSRDSSEGSSPSEGSE